MKKTILIFTFIILLINPLFAEVDPEKKYIVTGEQILKWQNHIISLQQYINNLTLALTDAELEIMVLKSEIAEWQAKYEHARKGLWVGIGTGYPLGAQGTVIYQFNERFGLFMISGYNKNFSINAGFIARVK